MNLKFNEILLTFFYCGKAKKAPGTIGSLAAVIFWLFLTKLFFDFEISIASQNIFWGIFLVLSFIYGCLATPFYSKQFGQIDHQTIVLDEVVGQILALQFTFFFLHQNYFSNISLITIHLIFCFTSFRFFDIIKPSFIGFCDRNLKSGFGVMFDDLLCGILTALIGWIFVIVILN
jgi:phosphatidylglycerophosphatase A